MKVDRRTAIASAIGAMAAAALPSVPKERARILAGYAARLELPNGTPLWRVERRFADGTKATTWHWELDVNSLTPGAIQ